MEPATTTAGRVIYAASGREVHILRDDGGVLRAVEVVITTSCLIQSMHAEGLMLGIVTVGGHEQGLYLYDISSPTRPRELGKYPGEFLDVRLAGTRAYLSAGAQGLVVLDISNARLPVKVSRIQPAPAFRTTSRAGGLHAGVVDLRVRGQVVYVAALGAGLLIWDLTDPLAPKQIGQFQTSGYAEAVEIDFEGVIAYVSNNIVTPFTIWAIDIRGPEKPALIGKFQGESVSGGISQVRAAEDRLYYLTYNTGYVSSWTLGVVKFGGLPSQFGPAKTPQSVGVLSHHGFPWDLEIEGSTAYVTDAEGISVIDLVEDGRPQERSRLVGSSPVKQLAVENGHAFLFGDSGMHVVDVTEPDVPASVAQLDLKAQLPYRVQNGVAYFAVGTGRGDLDLSRPAEPRWKDRSEGSGPAWCDGWTKLPVGDHCYRIEYVGPAPGVTAERFDRGKPVATLSVPLGAGPWSSRVPLAAYSHYVYVAGRQGLYVLDATNPATPYLVALKPLENGTFSLNSIDLSTPRGTITEYRTFGVQSIAISDARAYVLSGGLFVFDLSDPVAPVEVAYFETNAHTLVVDDGVVYLAGPYSELQVIRVALDQGEARGAKGR